MIRSLAVKLALFAITVGLATAHAKSRAMSAQQYTDFLNKLDAAVPLWQSQIDHLNTLNLSLDMDKRKQLAMKGALAKAILNGIKSKVLAEREYPSLALEITMSDTFATASGLLKELITDVSESNNRKTWEEAVRAIQANISGYAGPFYEHIIDKAYDLEYEVEDCHARSQKPRR
jgi:hypothetical protein